MDKHTLEWPVKGAIGLGFSHRANEVKGACLKNIPTENEVGNDGNPKDGPRTSYQLSIIENSKELVEELGVAASVAVQTPSGAGAKSTVEFARARRCDQHSVYVLARAVAVDAPQNLSHNQQARLDLVPNARQQLQENPLEFLDNFGDSFISGWVNGAEISVLLQLKSHSISDKDQIKAEVGGNVGQFTGSAQFSAKLSAVSEGRDLSLFVCKIGGPSLDWVKLDAAEIIANMNTFTHAMNEPTNKVRYLANVTPYRYLQKLIGVHFGDVDNILAQLESFAQVKLEYRDALYAISYVQDNRDQFVDSFDAKVLSDKQSTIANALEYLDEEINKVRRLSSLSNVLTPSKIRARSELKLANEAIADFPRRLLRLPQSAQDVLTLFRNPKTGQDPADGLYKIFLDKNNFASGVELWCVFPKDGSLARSYITLKRADNQTNSSYWPSSDVSEDNVQRWRRGNSLRTTYNKIAFDPETMEVDVRDVTFATTEPKGGSLVDAGSDGRDYETFKHACYGIASASNHKLNANQQNREPSAFANVDLRGTPFQIDPDVRWVNTGWDQRGGVSEAPQKSNDFQVCRINTAGAPGYCHPEGALRLKLRGKPPADKP